MTATNIINLPTQQTSPANLPTKEKGKWLREEFKKIGYNSRKISVKVDSYSMGSSIDVTIKSPDVKMTDDCKIQEIINNVEKIHRCSASGEILSGGNTYTNLNVDSLVWKVRCEPHIGFFKNLAEKIENGEVEHESYNDIGIYVDYQSMEITVNGKRVVWNQGYTDVDRLAHNLCVSYLKQKLAQM